MIPPDISINGRSYSLEDIRTGSFERHLSSDFERDLLLFIKAWLLGQPAFRINTSGTTGDPRSISAHREKMVLSARLTQQVFGLQPGDIALLCLSPKTVAGIMMAVRCLSIGMPMVCTEPAGNPLRSLPPAFGLRFTAMVPLQLETILNEGYEALLSKVRALLLGGAPVSTGLERRVEGAAIPGLPHIRYDRNPDPCGLPGTQWSEPVGNFYHPPWVSNPD
jgi:o-succinylbenzoate---CoA ligase